MQLNKVSAANLIQGCQGPCPGAAALSWKCCPGVNFSGTKDARAKRSVILPPGIQRLIEARQWCIRGDWHEGLDRAGDLERP